MSLLFNPWYSGEEKIWGRQYRDLFKLGPDEPQTAEALEGKALDAARSFFGEDAELELDPNYRVGFYGDKLGATITVKVKA
jgi:hypothetical protein